MDTPQQTPNNTNAPAAALALDSLTPPPRHEQLAAFVRSGVGTEVQPGRFVVDPPTALWSILHSEVSDPTFVISLLHSMTQRSLGLDPDGAEAAAVANAHVERFNQKVAAGAVVCRPMALYPSDLMEASPFLACQIQAATTPKEQDVARALQYMVHDGNIVIPQGARWMPHDVVTAEYVAAAVRDKNIQVDLNRSFDLISQLLSVAGTTGRDFLRLITPVVGVSIRGPLMWSQIQLGSRERGGPNPLKKLVQVSRTMCQELGREELIDVLNQGCKASAAALDAALMPAKHTIDALRAFENDNQGVISEQLSAA
jgi:hypothetical protein